MVGYPITVLLVDDQEIVAKQVESMLQDQPDIRFYYCKNPVEALQMAIEVSPTVILQDLVMPDVDGLMLVRFFRANKTTALIPMIVLSSKEEPKVKAEAFAYGANDYIVKLPDKIELLARIRHHSDGYIRLLERNEAYDALKVSQARLNAELKEAANYVSSLLPRPLTGKIQTDWRFIPSTELGGDIFGYHWLDDHHFVIYLLDVCGHGVGAALLSISVMNVLRSGSLPHTDFTDPVAVLRSLNKTFPMEKHNFMFFTLWYGVYNKDSRILMYATGGHPPGLLLIGKNAIELKTDGLIVGGMEEGMYEKASCRIPPNSTLYLFSDGAYEIMSEKGILLPFETFIERVKEANSLDALISFSKAYGGDKPFQDDLSLLKVTFS